MTISLPSNPSLENLKKQAKTLKKSWQQGEALALQRIRNSHPQYGNTPDETLRSAKPRLTDCQLVLARECGADGWLQLKAAVDSARMESEKQLPDHFVTIAPASATTIRTSTTARFTSALTRCSSKIRGWRKPTSGAQRAQVMPKQ